MPPAHAFYTVAVFSILMLVLLALPLSCALVRMDDRHNNGKPGKETLFFIFVALLLSAVGGASLGFARIADPQPPPPQSSPQTNATHHNTSAINDKTLP